MVPSPSSLLRSLHAPSLSFPSSFRLRSVLPGLPSVAYAALVVGISSYPYAASFVTKCLRAKAKAKAKKRRVKASIEIVHTLAHAGVSRKVIAHAIAVTEYPLSVKHVESLRRTGEKNKALRKFVEARKLRNRRKSEEKKRRELQAAADRKKEEDRQKVEEEKRRLERIVKHERAVMLFSDVVNELRQLQHPRSSAMRRHD